MNEHSDAFEANQRRWDALTPYHLRSAMYDVEGFIAGRDPITALERDLLGEVKGLHLLHLQCHFGQDTLGLARHGAIVTGLDLSGAALAAARDLTERCGLQAEWIQSNVLEHRPELDGRFDVVFTSYGTIGWLPDLVPWGRNIHRYMKPGGRFVIVDFHPILWVYDNDLERPIHPYFRKNAIQEELTGSYADPKAPVRMPSYSWNHGLSEVFEALTGAGLRIERFHESDGSPHDCFPRSVKGADGLYRIGGLEHLLPMVFGITATKA